MAASEDGLGWFVSQDVEFLPDCTYLVVVATVHDPEAVFGPPPVEIRRDASVATAARLIAADARAGHHVDREHRLSVCAYVDFMCRLSVSEL